MQLPVYLDHQATTPLAPEVLEMMLPYFTGDYGNAASMDHVYGARAKQAVERAREQASTLIGAAPDEIVWTSGSTESNNLALFGAVSDPSEAHVVCSAIEHYAVLDPIRRLQQLGAALTIVPVDRSGLVDPDAVKQALRPNTRVVSVMLANNEVGTIQMVKDIGSVVHESSSALLHSDATQAVGHIPVNVGDLGVDLLSLSAHKFYGPKGVGALFVRGSKPRVRLDPIIYGGGHERGMRSGTLNVPGIVGLGAAAELAGKVLPDEGPRVQHLRDDLERRLLNLPRSTVNGHPNRRLPHNLSITFPGVEAKALIVAAKDLAFSAGSACTSAKVEPSHVLLAIGLPEVDVHCSIRLGLGRSTDKETVEFAAETLIAAVTRLRRIA